MPSIILKSLFAAAALAGAAPMLAAPVFAAPSDAPPTVSLKYDAKTGKYCLTEPAATGSHIDRITCQTSARWSAQGFGMPKTVKLAAK